MMRCKHVPGCRILIRYTFVYNRILSQPYRCCVTIAKCHFKRARISFHLCRCTHLRGLSFLLSSSLLFAFRQCRKPQLNTSTLKQTKERKRERKRRSALIKTRSAPRGEHVAPARASAVTPLLTEGQNNQLEVKGKDKKIGGTPEP